MNEREEQELYQSWASTMMLAFSQSETPMVISGTIKKTIEEIGEAINVGYISIERKLFDRMEALDEKRKHL